MKANPGGQIDLKAVVGLGSADPTFVIAGGKDLGVLLHLTSAERQILRQALGLEEKDQDRPK